MKVLGFGLSGLVGSRIVELLQNAYEFEIVSSSTGIDIRERDAVMQAVTTSASDIVFHCAAKADVDACEAEKVQGKDSDTWKINVLGTQHIIDACKVAKKKIIFISTDFVFDGKKGDYKEEDMPHPINWYAESKYQAELLVQKSGLDYLIIRIAYPYRASFAKKNDFVRAMLARLQKGQIITAVADHIMTPTFIDDIAQAIDTLLQSDKTGIYHIVGSQHITPFDAARCIATVFDLDPGLIQKTTLAEFFKDKAQRPFNLTIENDKIKQLGIQMSTFEKGLEAVKQQLISNF